jgi:hypothetical protein
VDAVAHTLESSATRSVIREVNNTTSRRLGLHGGGDHDWGGFRQLPPDPIAPRATGLFTSQSNGLLTGTQGNVQYRLDADGTIFHLEWDNPFVGDNEALCRVEGPNADFYATASVTGGGNTSAHMRYPVGEKADASPRQRDWRVCPACTLLVCSLEHGPCAARPRGITRAPGDVGDVIAAPDGEGSRPAGMDTRRPGSIGDVVRDEARPRPAGIDDRPPSGLGDVVRDETPADPATAGMPLFGEHEAAGDVLHLPYGVPGPNREGGWRKCRHCRALFFGGGGATGVCPGRRGGHAAEDEGPDFQLAYEMPARPSQQDNWRFCDKCLGLFLYPQNADGVCPAGEHHNPYPGHPDNYVLDRV